MNASAFSYFDHDADIGITGRGPNPAAAFAACASAMFAIMAEPGGVQPVIQVSINFEETDLELALVTWLNHLLAEARERGMVFSRFELSQNGPHWQGTAWGDHWQENTERGTEVKGATLTMLSVKQHGDEWVASCVVDV